jgi:hypothetical protein
VHAVFVPVTLKEMTSGAHSSAAVGGGRCADSEKKVNRLWAASAVGLEVVPVALFPFPYFFFLFFFCYYC